VCLDQPADIEERPSQEMVAGDDPDGATLLDDVELRSRTGWLRQVNGVLEPRDPLEGDELGANRLLLAVGQPDDRRCDRNERGDDRLGPATAPTARS